VPAKKLPPLAVKDLLNTNDSLSLLASGGLKQATIGRDNAAIHSVSQHRLRRGLSVEARIIGRAWRFVVPLLLLVLGGCLFTPSKALAPLPDKTKAELAQKGLSVGAPIFIRIHKLEGEMEVWMRHQTGRYVLLRTYPICNWSGDVGPKVREGDKQAPEGFYVVTAKQLNPKSEYYLSFNIGYPNAYDLANGYTGSALMVHGGCRSSGCYAITDEAIQELYIFVREAFAAGQTEFPIHAFPFRMSAEAMAFRKGHKWESFWLNLKEGYDAFEMMAVPPVVGVKNRRYMFFANAVSVPDEFRVAKLGDKLAPTLITGWKN
jgi:murein L,D-transpeptidase YafK